VNLPPDLHSLLGSAWPTVLQHLDDAVLVIDQQRILRFVNDRARRLLGYEEEQPVGGRCRLTTRGLDCENACPLTFALEGDIDRIESFSTVYQSRDGRPVPLKVTVIPVLDDDGAFQGAIEILRPTEPDPGFVLAGRSESSLELRQQLMRAVQPGLRLHLVGEAPAVADVARAVHRFAGLADSLFYSWQGSWASIPEWPPGTVFADGDRAESILSDEPPSAWRVIVGDRAAEDPPAALPGFELVVLPQAYEFGDDLPLVVRAWVARIAPGVSVTPEAVSRLGRMVSELGFERCQRPLLQAVAAARECLDESHIPSDGYRSAYVDELLERPDPLAALEKRLIREVLERSGWRMQEAAERLGVSRVTLWRKLKDHGIERPENSSAE
jgi:PAS domain S-box-containing protein